MLRLPIERSTASITTRLSYRLRALVLEKEGVASEALKIAGKQEAGLFAARAAQTLAEYRSAQGRIADSIERSRAGQLPQSLPSQP
jgi:hypothetical protein